MSKKIYKELREKMKNTYNHSSNNNYGIVDGVGTWMVQCDVKPTQEKLELLCKINGGKYFYPYQKADRKVILKYLKKNSYKDFKNDTDRDK